MTKEEFINLQLHHQESGKTLKDYLKETCVGYSTYNYWRKKFLFDEKPHDRQCGDCIAVHGAWTWQRIIERGEGTGETGQARGAVLAKEMTAHGATTHTTTGTQQQEHTRKKIGLE